jgi:hypothetical protein
MDTLIQKLSSRKFLLAVIAGLVALNQGETLAGIAIAALYVLVEGAGDVAERAKVDGQ